MVSEGLALGPSKTCLPAISSDEPMLPSNRAMVGSEVHHAIAVVVSEGLRSGKSEGLDMVNDPFCPKDSVQVPLAELQVLFTMLPVISIFGSGMTPAHSVFGDGLVASHEIAVVPVPFGTTV